jgi:long-chain fatty acid transport protein
VILLSLILSNTVIYGGGFQVNEHGARVTAMGGAFAGLANDASALYFNAAGITQLRGFNAMLGTTLIFPSTSFRGPSPAVDEVKMVKQMFYPSHIYLTYQITDKLHAGVGMNNPFGLGTKWEDDYVGRFVALETVLRTYAFYPTVAYQVLDNLSLSASLVYNKASVKIIRKLAVNPFDAEGKITLEGDAKPSFGYNFGLLWKPFDALSVGATYRSNASYEFEGTATSTSSSSQLTSRLPAGDIVATFEQPNQIVVGLAYQATSQLMLTSDFQYIGWSSYDSLKVNFVDPAFPDLAAPKEYKNSFIIRFGAEYNFNDKLDLRCGLLYDKNPTPDERLDPSLPDSDRLGLTLGAGYQLTSNLNVNLSYMFLRFVEREVTTSKVNYTPYGTAPLNGVYNSTANLFGLSLSYNF